MLEGREAKNSDRVGGGSHDQLHSSPCGLQAYQPESQEAVRLGSYQSDRTKGRDDPLRAFILTLRKFLIVGWAVPTKYR